jgi:hypothetical protein
MINRKSIRKNLIRAKSRCISQVISRNNDCPNKKTERLIGRNLSKLTMNNKLRLAQSRMVMRYYKIDKFSMQLIK